MRIAEILSDLTSLRVCDHQSALALVSCHEHLSADASTTPHIPSESTNSTPSVATIGAITRPTPMKKSSSIAGAAGDPDLQRAMDLVDLHYGVKMPHVDGVDQGLEQARRDVEEVVATMDGELGSRRRRG